jgi:NAD(P)-dependent dehydrogenase (short-subunit alcohol dehydrogenase family)
MESDGAASFASAGTFIVLGGSGGIGSAVARRLVARGTSVVLAARSPERLEPLAADLGATWTAVDATDFDAVDRLVREVAQRDGRIGGIVNAVGSILLKPAHMTSADEWQDVLARNLTSAFAVARAAGRTMTTGGSVVLVSTVAASVGLPNHDAIAAAKGGVAALVRSAASTYASRRLRFNAVAPGLVDTPLASRITSSPTARERSRAMHPLGRIGVPEDIAAPIEWLLDPATSWVTGQVIGIDGGLGALRT